MSARIEQAKWALTLRSRERPPGCLPSEDDPRVSSSEIDVRLAVRGFSVEIESGDEPARERAADVLGWLGDARGISPLIRALADPASTSAERRRSAFSRFDALPAWTAEPLLRALDDDDQVVRAQTTGALSCCQSPLAIDGVSAALGDQTRVVRCSAARALSDLGARGVRSEVAIAGLSALLAEADARVAYEGYWALRAQGGTATDGQCAAWRWSDSGQRAWRQIAG